MKPIALHRLPIDASVDAPSPVTQTMVVRGGSFCLFEVAAGDRVVITNDEGRQAADLYVKAGVFEVGPFETGTLETGTLETEMSEPASSLAELLRTGAGASAGFGAALDGRRTALQDLRQHTLFAPDIAPGAHVALVAAASSLCVIVAPGGPMQPDRQDAPSDLSIAITPASVAARLPPPLAPVRFDLRIEAATAQAYRVAAGDYIQIIDVEGRQCTDFLAFDAAALAQGDEYGLDATVTHTLMGSTAPKPGLHSKYFDARLKPLIEVIQDTVGRHDTFMLACSAKYYEDMGYPGHANCTDNFNAALAPFSVAPRKGWPAINFFYNTTAEADDRIGMDEPWSRPGDYVLLRALRDLVCASSSCADDIDPANAWDPTDIHVRIYDADSAFTKGMSHRMTPQSEPRLTRQSGFYARTAALTRNFEDYRGFWLPTSFASEGPIAEYWACRERAIIMDLSALRKFEIVGPDAEDLMQLALTRNVKKLAVGQVVYTAMCYPHGGMIDDGTLFRLGAHNFRWICGDDYSGLWLRTLAADHGLKAWVKSSTDQLHNVAVQGPASRAILAQIVATPPHQASLDELKWFRFTIGRIADVPVVVSRTGYTGELGYEVWCHPTQAPAVWDAIWAAGQPLGLTPMGLAALDMLRIEAGLVFAGYDFCDQIDPFEAGIGFTVAKDKTDAYVGAEAIARRRDTPQKQLVGLDIHSNEPVGHGDRVFLGRAQIGVVTSGTKSPILGKAIALARLDVSTAEPGLAVEIGKLDGHQKRLPATVVPFPHFDPKKTRVRGEGAVPPVAPAPRDTVATAGIPA